MPLGRYPAWMQLDRLILTRCFDREQNSPACPGPSFVRRDLRSLGPTNSLKQLVDPQTIL